MTPIDRWFGVPGEMSILPECARAVLVFAYGVQARRLVLEPSGKISIVRDFVPPEQHQAVVGERRHI